MAKNGETTEIDPEELEIGKDSKTVYVNDTYNLDTIPFDIENIIEEITEVKTSSRYRLDPNSP
jgi:hypothetical protein